MSDDLTIRTAGDEYEIVSAGAVIGTTSVSDDGGLTWHFDDVDERLAVRGLDAPARASESDVAGRG